MPSKSAVASLPVVKISRRGAKRLQDGHVWVYRSDIISAERVAPGAAAGITDERGKFLGTALYSSSSQIAIRLISPHAVNDVPGLVRERILGAIGYRERVVRDTDAYRVIFSEADFLPGLIVDRYNDLLSMQALTQAMDAEPVRSVVVAELKERLKPASIAERVDPRIRELEQLPARPSGLIYGEKTSTIITMNGVRFHYQALEGQKTGAFLDQRENYAAAARFAHGEALDVFCYQGGFALHLAQSGAKVTGVDSSRPALEVADRNAALNTARSSGSRPTLLTSCGTTPSRPQLRHHRARSSGVRQKQKQSRDRPARLQRAQPARPQDAPPGRDPDQLLCSYHVSPAQYLEVVGIGPRCPQKSSSVENRGQAKDHPILLNVPETEYLKCVIAYLSS